MNIANVKAQDYSDYDGCAEQDSLALVAFFNATDGENWITQLWDSTDTYPVSKLKDMVKTYYQTEHPNAGRGKWLEGPVKDWFGVLLEKQPVSGSNDSVWRVIHLQPRLNRRAAGTNNLAGYIPEEVGLLTALEMFAVNGSDLKDSELPDGVYQPYLSFFDVEETGLIGDISNEIRNCPYLSYINMRINGFDTMPTLDFLDPDSLVENTVTNAQTMWWYENHLSYACLQPTAEYFMSINEDIPYEMHDMTDVGREYEFILTPGESITLSAHGLAGSKGTYPCWYANGFKMPNTDDEEYTVSDTGVYKVKILNDYIADNGASKPEAYEDTKSAEYHVVYTPVTPECDTFRTSYSGNKIIMKFSKPMAVPTTSQASEFSVTSGSNTISGIDIERTGRLNNKLVLTLETPVDTNADVTISYTKGSVVCKNGGELESFTKQVENLTRNKPTLLSAITSVSGESIILTFDKYIDGETLDPDDFSISGSDVTSVSDIVLKDGELDEDISKKVELVFDELLDSKDELTISYTRGSLCGLYGGMLDSFNDTTVENVVVSTRIEVTLNVIDGSEKIDQIVVGGLKSKSIKLYDNGTNGDTLANDHIWSLDLSLAPDTYAWKVYTRAIEYDTITSNDTIYFVVSDNSSNDSLISSNTSLSFTLDTISGVTGSTLYEYHNYTITFLLDLNDYLTNNTSEIAEPYLMGIDDEWVDGIEMEVYDDSVNYYIAQITKRMTGNKLEFAFRNSSTWETSTANLRSHTVVANDTVYGEFGVLTGIQTAGVNTESVLLYPNPAATNVTVRLTGDVQVKSLAIITLTGQVVSVTNAENSIPVDYLENGLYMLRITDSDNNIYFKQLLKQ